MFESFKAMSNANIRVNFFTLKYCQRNACKLRDVSIWTMIILDISCKHALALFKQVI